MHLSDHAICQAAAECPHLIPRKQSHNQSTLLHHAYSLPLTFVHLAAQGSSGEKKAAAWEVEEGHNLSSRDPAVVTTAKHKHLGTPRRQISQESPSSPWWHCGPVCLHWAYRIRMLWGLKPKRGRQTLPVPKPPASAERPLKLPAQHARNAKSSTSQISLRPASASISRPNTRCTASALR